MKHNYPKTSQSLAILTLLGVQICYATVTDALNSPNLSTRAGGITAPEDVTFVLPIWEGALASNKAGSDMKVLLDMKEHLNQTSFNANTKSVLGWSFSSFAMSRDTTSQDANFTFVEDNLLHELSLAEQTNTPILVHVNDGHWAAGSFPNATGGYDSDTLIEYLAHTYPETTMFDPNGSSIYSSISGENWFCLSRLNHIYRDYKMRNVGASARVIAEWAKKHPDLFAGVSLESETRMNNMQSDYNPYVVQEWIQWLTHTGIYGPGSEFFGHGRVPSFDTIQSFNDVMDTTFASWDDLTPPKDFTVGQIFSEEWQRWRIMQVINSNADNTLLLIQNGIDRKQVFGHQTPQLDFYNFADDLSAATAPLGAGGLTFYAWNPADYGMVVPPLRARGSNRWGNFELNPLSSDFSSGYNNMEALRDHGIKIVCPNAWEDYAHIRDMYAMYNSEQYGDAWGQGLGKWMSDHENEPRYTQPEPWNPGQKVLDLYDNFANATASTGADNHQEANATCGNVVRKSIYSAASGSISWTVAFPSVKDTNTQRLNLWTSLGVKDGASTNGGPVSFQIVLDGNLLLGTNGLTLPQNYWTWKRWVPIMIDITPWEGQTKTLSLVTNTSAATGGDMLWGAPQIFNSASAGENLAQGRSVTVSSQSSDKRWDPKYLVDGIEDSQSTGPVGWSSALRKSANSTEWAIIDLGSAHDIGKVVLFSRSDPTDANGSGFPVDFTIAGSLNGGNATTGWTDLVAQTNFPGTQGGEGEIFLFESASVRYLRVQATKLSGVGLESGYAMQLGEIEAFQ